MGVVYGLSPAAWVILYFPSNCDDDANGTNINSSGLTYGRLFHVSQGNGPYWLCGGQALLSRRAVRLGPAERLIQIAQTVLQTLVEVVTGDIVATWYPTWFCPPASPASTDSCSD